MKDGRMERKRANPRFAPTDVIVGVRDDPDYRRVGRVSGDGGVGKDGIRKTKGGGSTPALQVLRYSRMIARHLAEGVTNVTSSTPVFVSADNPLQLSE